MKYNFVGVIALMLVYAGAMARADIKSSADDVEPLNVLDQIPEVQLMQLDGNRISLSDALNGQPGVLIFFRGSWCPLCAKQLEGLKGITSSLVDMGYKVVAISPDSVKNMKRIMARIKPDYQILCDTDYEAVQQFRLAFRVDDETLNLFEGAGLKLNPMLESGEVVLPVPAVFIVDGQGVIQFRYFNVDYRERLSPDTLLEAAGALISP